MAENNNNNNRVVSIILSIILIFFASFAAHKLPKSATLYLENIWFRFFIFCSIAYLATKDLVASIIATIAVMISYQSLAVHKITDTVIDKTKQLLNSSSNIPVPYNNIDLKYGITNSINNIPVPYNNIDLKFGIANPINTNSTQNNINTNSIQNNINTNSAYNNINTNSAYNNINTNSTQNNINTNSAYNNINTNSTQNNINTNSAYNNINTNSAYNNINTDTTQYNIKTNSVHNNTNFTQNNIKINNDYLQITDTDKQIINYTLRTIQIKPDTDINFIINSISLELPELDRNLIQKIVNDTIYNNNLKPINVLNNIVTNNVNDNVKMPIKKYNTKKFLQDNTVIPSYNEENNYGSSEFIDTDNNILTGSCTKKHLNNYNCNNIPKYDENIFNGFSTDYSTLAKY